MDSPLKYDENIVKEFKLKPESELETVYKLSYARTQLEEIKKFLYRERVELLLAEGQAKSNIEILAGQAQQKIIEHRNNIKGVALSIGILEKLVEELEAAVSD